MDMTSHVHKTFEKWMDMNPMIKKYTITINSHKPHNQQDHDGQTSDQPQDHSEYDIITYLYILFERVEAHTQGTTDNTMMQKTLLWAPC